MPVVDAAADLEAGIMVEVMAAVVDLEAEVDLVVAVDSEGEAVHLGAVAPREDGNDTFAHRG